jgi:hypothetical protein
MNEALPSSEKAYGTGDGDRIVFGVMGAMDGDMRLVK